MGLQPSGASRFALSTGWHLAHIDEPAQIPSLTAELGFDGIELSSLSAEAAGALRGLLASEPLPVVSIHAPCPIPYEGAARLDDLACTDDRRRRAAVDYTKRTIDLAAGVDAGAVVIHLGAVPVSIPQSAIVAAMEQRDDQWRDLLARGLAEREARVQRHFDLAIESLGDLTAHLHGSGVRLAVETRYEYNSLPNVDEFATILDRFAKHGVRYWHDVGHAHTQAVLGLATHQDYLDRYHTHLLGFHIHDAQGTRDHLPPGEGEIDFAALVRYLRPEHLRVLEVASRHPAHQVARSREYLKARGW